MNDYIHNKQPKDPNLCKLIRKTITVNRKELGLEFEDVACELGLNQGTLSNKLKPSMATADLTLNEFIHFLELTGDYAALDYIADKFGMVLVPKNQAQTKVSDINLLVDMASIENNDVFRTVKMAIADDVITPEEKKAILKEINEAQKANAELKDLVLHTAISEVDK